jgi:hypothetical protein
MTRSRNKNGRFRAKRADTHLGTIRRRVGKSLSKMLRKK